jgi:lactate dehydrogenase-like 2-hydroxyacid dehydrogenase
MKFRKILTVGIGEASLDAEYWKRIDALAASRISLPTDSPDIVKQLADTDCLLVNPFVFKVGQDLIDAAPHLKYIGVLATAYGKVDAAYAKAKGIAVCNVPGYSTEAVAEFIFAAILEHVRDLERGKRKAAEGDYSGAGFTATEIKGKTFGILGLGSIGGRVAEIALGFGADVRYWSRTRKPDIEAGGAVYEAADILIPKCDFLSLNFAQTKETERFLDEKRLMAVNPGAIIVNTAPMELVDISALEKRLQKGDVTFILDHSDEMTAEDLKKLSRHKNCVIYPPIAYVTKEARIAKQEIFTGNMAAFLNGRPQNVVR